MKLAAPVFLNEGRPVDPEVLALGVRKMADRLQGGGRVVIGADHPAQPGLTIAQDGERHLVVLRRATRRDFLDAAPITCAEDERRLAALHTPFYYELELWDRVIEDAEGNRLGIRLFGSVAISKGGLA